MAMAVAFSLLVVGLLLFCDLALALAAEFPMLLITNGQRYTPSPVGRGAILTGGGSIIAILPEDYAIANLTGLPVKVVDARGGFVVPGLVDMHVHVTGEAARWGLPAAPRKPPSGSFSTPGLPPLLAFLAPTAFPADDVEPWHVLVQNSLENLRVKVAALQQQGITAHMWSGCYRVPSPTLTGSLIRDLQLIEEVVGAGEIAISDHRSSWPTTQELLNLVTDARVGGMLSGKAGIVHFHTGSADSLLQPLWDVVNASKGAIPLTHMIPTHVSGRGPALLKAAEEWVTKGGRVDFTSDQEGEGASHNALMDWSKRVGNVALQGVSLSSDAFGSLPTFDSEGQLVDYTVASPKANLNTIRRLVQEGKWALEDALQLSTTNPASFLSFKSKGKLEAGADADILILSPQSLEVQYVIAGGKLLKSPSEGVGDYCREAFFAEKAPALKKPACIDEHVNVHEPLKDWKGAVET